MGTRGRPSKEPSAEDRAKVADLLAKEVPIKDLAKMFGMTPPTFRKYFQSEFLSGKKIPVDKRPSREVTNDHRAKVIKYLGFGMAPEKVALALDYIGPGEFDAFKSDFSLELEIADAKARAAVIDRLDQQSAAGVAAATSKLEALSRPVPAKEAAAPRGDYFGKKASAVATAEAAVAAGGKFAPRVPPRLAAVGGQRVEGKPAK
jgi:hypothetical protein